jgi:hypothetical protein
MAVNGFTYRSRASHLKRFSFGTKTRTAGGDTICLAQAAEVNPAVLATGFSLRHLLIAPRSLRRVRMPRKISGVDPALDEPQRNIFHSEVEALQVRAQRGSIADQTALAGPLFRGTSAIPFTLSVINGRAQRYLAQPKMRIRPTVRRGYL